MKHTNEHTDVIFGRNNVLEALRSERTIDKILVSGEHMDGSAKKIIAIALVLILALSLVACGAKEEAGAKIAAQKGTTSFMYASVLANTKTVSYEPSHWLQRICSTATRITCS